MKYHSQATGPDKTSFRTGFAKAISIATTTDGKSILILANGLNNQQGLYNDILGPDFVKQLSKSKHILYHGINIYLETERITSAFRRGVIFAAYISSSLLQKALIDSRGTDVIYLPWSAHELATYCAVHTDSGIL